MADQNNALIVGIAQIIDYPSVYMGGPSETQRKGNGMTKGQLDQILDAAFAAVCKRHGLGRYAKE